MSGSLAIRSILRPGAGSFRRAALVAVSTSALLLAACGGGGGGGGGSSAAPVAAAAPGPATGSGSTGTTTTTCATTAGACPGADSGTIAKAVVPVAPVVATQPQSIAVTSGRAASFAVVATSESAPTFQWSRNGTPINGANATTYTIAATQLTDSTARFTVAVTNAVGTTTSAAAILTVNAPIVETAASAARPFSDQSPWNARPTAFTLGTYVVPKSDYFPNVAEGAYSVGVFTASSSDAAVSVKGPNASTGIYIADAEAWVDQVTIPHWPANLRPATGSDGHADIVDVAANKIHSFYALTNDAGVWRAQQYTWTALDGRGFGTPGQYFQGSRAAGVVPMAGLLRTAEIDDGLPMYRHAMAMSMTFNALAANPAYAFPATAADYNAASLNSGQIPEGALMMLPASFDLSTIKNPKLLKIARTLQTYGAYVVDANQGTPFLIYAEIGSGFQLMPNGWDNAIAAELDQLRAALRQVVSSTAWVDANGVPFTPEKNFNLMSMRGTWYVLTGGAPGVFDTWEQAVIFPDNGTFTRQINATGRSIPPCNWALPEAGRQYRITVKASGNASLQLDLVDGAQVNKFSTGTLKDGQSLVFTWPSSGLSPWLSTASGPNGGGKVSATLVAL